MKKLLTIIVCFMVGITLVKAEPPVYRLGITSEGTPAVATDFMPGENFSVSVHLESILQDENVNNIYLSLVYDKSIFEITSNVSNITHPTGWNLTLNSANPEYGISGYTYSDPTTGTQYLLSSDTNSYTMDYNNGGTRVILASGITFKVKENAPMGNYKIWINPKYPVDQSEPVDYDSYIEVTVLGGALQKCIIDAYNTKNNASKSYDAILTAEEAATITELECLIEDAETNSSITDVNEIKKLVNLTSLKLGRVAATTAIDFKENTKLKKLYIGGDTTSIKVDNNTNLEELTIVSDITSIDLSKNTRLTTLWFTAPKITSVDLSKNTELVDVTLNAPLTTLDLTKNTKLENLTIHNASLATLDLSKNTKLKADKLIIEDGSLIKKVSVKLNESIALPHIVQLPSHLSVTRTVIHSGNYADIENNKIIGKKIAANALASGELVSVDYYVDDTHFFTETFDVNVTNVSNPKTGVFDVSAFIIIIGLLSYFLYRNVKNKNTSMSLQ